MVIKSGRFGRFLACPGYPECKFTKPLVVEMPGRCPKCGGRILKKTSRNGYTYYGCDKFPTCDFMTWDVPVKDDCPVCGQTMFKKAGRGFNKPFCANPACSNFLPEDKRGYRRRKPAEDGENAAEKPAEGAQPAENGRREACQGGQDHEGGQDHQDHQECGGQKACREEARRKKNGG